MAVSAVNGAKADIKEADQVVQDSSFLADIYKRAGARVVGSVAEKACYYAVFLLAMSFFLASVGNVLGTLANDRVTTFALTQEDAIEFPIFWYCFESSTDKAKDQQVKFGFRVLGDNVNVNPHPGDKTCEANNDFALINVPLGTGANIHDSTKCYGPNELDRMEDGITTCTDCAAGCCGKGHQKFVKKLEAEMADILQDDYDCYVVNDARQLPAKKRMEGGPLLRKFRTAPKVGMDPNIYVGFTDPDIDLDKDHIIYAKPQALNFYNAYIDVSLTTDVVTESSQVSFLTPSGSCDAAQDSCTKRRHYYGQITSQPQSVGAGTDLLAEGSAGYQYVSNKDRDEYGLDLEGFDRLDVRETEVHYQFSSFLTRDVTIRRKSLAEAWAEVGGAWATALMLLTFFFLPRQQGYEEWQVFRFRSVASRQGLLRAVATGAKDAGFVATDYMADVETGPKLLQSPEWPDSPKAARK